MHVMNAVVCRVYAIGSVRLRLSFRPIHVIKDQHRAFKLLSPTANQSRALSAFAFADEDRQGLSKTVHCDIDLAVRVRHAIDLV